MKGLGLSVEVDHQLATRLPGWENRRDPSTASEAELLWYYFPGDVRIAAGQSALVSSVGSIPALNFASSMLQACQWLSEGRAYKYVFTEASESITFVAADGDSVVITGSFASVRVVAGFGEFVAGVRDFVTREMGMLSRQYPGLRDHELTRKYELDLDALANLGR